MTREDEIFEKLKKGDPDAAGELARLYYDDILRYCLFHVPDRSLAQDAVQETFLKVFRHFGSYRHRGRFRAFLYRVAANVCVDICRRRTWEPVPEQVPFEEKGLRRVRTGRISEDLWSWSPKSCGRSSSCAFPRS